MKKRILKNLLTIILAVSMVLSTAEPTLAKVESTTMMGNYEQRPKGKLCWLISAYQSATYQTGTKQTGPNAPTSWGNVIRRTVAKGTKFESSVFGDDYLVKVYNGETIIFGSNSAFRPVYGAEADKTAEAMNIIAKANGISNYYVGVQRAVSWSQLYRYEKYCPLLEYEYTLKNGSTGKHWVCVKDIVLNSNGTYTVYITDPTNGKTDKMLSTDFADNYAKYIGKRLGIEITSGKWVGTVY